MVESPDWLASYNKYHKAEENLHKMARWNGLKMVHIKLKREGGRNDDIPTSNDSRIEGQKDEMEESTQMKDISAPIESNDNSRMDVCTESKPVGDSVKMSVPLSLFFTDPKLRIHVVVTGILW